MNRRSLITGLTSLVAAPAVIRTTGLLMPVRALPVETAFGTAWGPTDQFITTYQWHVFRMYSDGTWKALPGELSTVRLDIENTHPNVYISGQERFGLSPRSLRTSKQGSPAAGHSGGSVRRLVVFGV